MKNKGFTLIELAIVLVIMGLLIGVGVSLLPGLINQQKYTQNQSLLNRNYNALIGSIMANGKVPLASSDTNGQSGSQNIGYLPYSSIGGLQKDAYGKTMYYAVTSRALSISINGNTATSLSLVSTNNMQNFCAVLYALDYYYNSNTNLNSNDIRVENAPNTASIPVVFIVVSSGANNKLDAPNTITNSNGIFASGQYPLSQNYDDQSMALPITGAIGQFCASYQLSQPVSYSSGAYNVDFNNSGSGSANNTNGNNTGSGSNNNNCNTYCSGIYYFLNFFYCYNNCP